MNATNDTPSDRAPMTQTSNERLVTLLRLGASGERAIADIQPSGLPTAPLLALADEMEAAADALLLATIKGLNADERVAEDAKARRALDAHFAPPASAADAGEDGNEAAALVADEYVVRDYFNGARLSQGPVTESFGRIVKRAKVALRAAREGGR